jgi:hypothetical protein
VPGHNREAPTPAGGWPEGGRAVAASAGRTALLDAGVPDAEVPRLERLASTFPLGFAASEVGGRFGPGDPDPSERRGLLRGKPLPGHRARVRRLEAPADWDAEFEADLDDLLRLIEAAAAGR